MSTSDVKLPDGINCFFTVFKNVYALEDNEERKILAAILDFWRPFFFFGGGGQDHFKKKKQYLISNVCANFYISIHF